jgi:hypothetical protein
MLLIKENTQPWNGGSPSLYIIEKDKLRDKIEEFKTSKLNKIHTETGACLKKYFTPLWTSFISPLLIIKGIIIIIISSNINHWLKGEELPKPIIRHDSINII